jgi:hypothetical protein
MRHNESSPCLLRISEATRTHREVLFAAFAVEIKPRRTPRHRRESELPFLNQSAIVSTVRFTLRLFAAFAVKIKPPRTPRHRRESELPFLNQSAIVSTIRFTVCLQYAVADKRYQGWDEAHLMRDEKKSCKIDRSGLGRQITSAGRNAHSEPEGLDGAKAVLSYRSFEFSGRRCCKPDEDEALVAERRSTLLLGV